MHKASWVYPVYGCVLRGFLSGTVFTPSLIARRKIPPATWGIPSYISLRGYTVATRLRGEAARPSMCNKPQGSASPIKK